MKVDISGLSKAVVLQALHANSHAQGISFLHERSVTVEDCAKVIQGCKGGRLYFDYFCGRVIKVDLTGDEFDPDLYDRDNGQGAAQLVVDSLK